MARQGNRQLSTDLESLEEEKEEEDDTNETHTEKTDPRGRKYVSTLKVCSTIIFFFINIYIKHIL